MTPVEQQILENARDGKELCAGFPVGKELGRAQNVMIDLLEREWIAIAARGDAAFKIKEPGRRALKEQK